MACTYIYAGREYSESEILQMLEMDSVEEVRGDRVDFADGPSSRVSKDSPLKTIIEESKYWTKESEESQTMQYKGSIGNAARVTAKVLGIINKMRGNPLTDASDSYALQTAKARWGNISPTTALDTPLGFMNMETYAQKVQEEYDSVSKRGTLLHLYFKMYAQSNQAAADAVSREINEFKQKHGIKDYTYNWLAKKDQQGKAKIERIYSRIGVNSFDDGVPPDQRDKIFPEIAIGNYLDLIIDGLGVAGTPDLVVEHANKEVSLFDLKTGPSFNKEHSFELFKYGSQANIAIYNNHRDRAKLQLTWYAILMKLANPDIKFRNIAVAWIPNSKMATAYDHRAAVELGDYLAMIEAYLRNEHKETYKNLIDKYGKKIFQAKEYLVNYEVEVKAQLEERELKSEIERKLDELRQFVLFDIKEYSDADEETFKLQNKKQAAKIFGELIKLLNDFKIPKNQLSQINDISWLTMWLGSNSDINSVWIQYYDKMLKDAKDKATTEALEKTQKFDALNKAIIADDTRLYGKAVLDKIPMFRGWLNLTSSADRWAWVYKNIEDAEGNVIGRRIRYTEDDFKDMQQKFPNLGAIEQRKALARFMVDTYSEFFINSKAKNGKAVANITATIKIDSDGVPKEYSNLDLANEARADRDNLPFQYQEGWFPKIPKLLEEFGTILSPSYRQEVWNRSVKSHIEDQFEQAFNNIEAIPFKYLGSNFIETSMNYSLNAEAQFKKFVTHTIMKKHLDNVYAFGKGLEFYLRYDPKVGGVDKDANKLKYKNTIDYLKTAIEMQVRGRKQMEFPGGLFARQDFLPRAGGDAKVYKIDWLKVLHTLKSVASAPIMWLKAGAGTANGVFIGLFTLKEAVKNDIMKTRGATKFLGVEGDEFSFGVKDLAWATGQYFKMQKDAMAGNLQNNKLFLMAKKLRYLPDDYDWGGSTDSLLTTRLKAVSKSTMYMFHSVPEEFIALITMASQLKSMKVPGGKSVWDAYELVTEPIGPEQYSTIKWNDSITRGKVRAVDGSITDLKELDVNEIRRLHYVYQRLNGGYRPDERTRMEYFVLGEMFMQFKKYLPNILRSGWASKHTNYAWGRYKLEKGANPEQIKEWHASVMEGRWKVMGGLLLNVMLIGKLASKYPSLGKIRDKWLGLQPNEAYNWKELSNEQREIVVDAAVTVTFITLLMTGRHFMYAGGGGGDDNYIKQLYSRIISNFSQQWNVYAVMEDILSPNVVPASWRWSWQFMQASTDFFLASSLLAAGQEEVAGFKPLTKSGDIRGWNQLQRSIPVLSAYRDFYRLLESGGVVEEPLNPSGRR